MLNYDGRSFARKPSVFCNGENGILNEHSLKETSLTLISIVGSQSVRRCDLSLTDCDQSITRQFSHYFNPPPPPLWVPLKAIFWRVENQEPHPRKQLISAHQTNSAWRSSVERSRVGELNFASKSRNLLNFKAQLAILINWWFWAGSALSLSLSPSLSTFHAI